MRNVLIICLIVMLGVGPALATHHALTEGQVKALFLINFTRYVEWPEDAFAEEDSPFVIGVKGRSPFGDNLARLAHGRTAAGRQIVLVNPVTSEELQGCHILFIDAAEASRLEEILSRVRGFPVLTVGEDTRFAQSGGMVRFVKRDENIRLEINLKAARSGNLLLSSQFLRVADSILEE